jgi:thiamine biosynthesis lipoprotein
LVIIMALIAQSSRKEVTPVMHSSSGLPLRKVEFYAMGTPCEIQFVAPKGDVQAKAFEHQVTEWVKQFEAKYSRYKTDSLISKINRAAGLSWIDIDTETELLLKICDSLYFTTQSIIDPTTLPLMTLWNWKAEIPTIPSQQSINEALSKVGWKKVQRSPGKIMLPEIGMALDFGGFGKEYAVDFVAQLAQQNGITDALIDFGHDIRTLGLPPGRPAWHIGLENPSSPGNHTSSLGIQGSKGIASSGDYIRFFTYDGKRYGHIIDPRTGWPVAHGCVQSTVVASSCLIAGALATTSFILGVPKGIEFIQSFPGAEGMIVTQNSRAQTRAFFNHVVS